MSEFRQHYVRNYTFPSHPLATSILTSQAQAILNEGDGDKLVVTRGIILPPVLFTSVRYYWLILNKSILNILNQ